MRKKSRRHKQLKILTYRYDLPKTDRVELENLKRGYDGELEFDRVLTDEFGDVDFIHIKDYCFKVEGEHLESTKSESSIDREIQIDNIIIAGDRVLTFEVKNYNFDLKYGETHWTYINGRKFSDPLIQIRRQQNTLQELIEAFDLAVKVFSTIVFINPNQTIYNLPEHPEIIVRSNLLGKLKKVLWENRHDYSELRAHLEARQLSESQYQGEVGVLFEELKPGVFCGACGERLERITHLNFLCVRCNKISTKLSAIKRLVWEMKTLNNSWIINPSILSQLSGGEISEGCVRRHVKEGNIRY
ncbi:nuclease-related domain-containing protein [Salinicoccus sp. YB14-2]|uniref:nuclease-related domain-containing protein n=1 Tax=Salinicoccus sp. YB14-2 TaxID=1572701 RepID=UPI00068FC0E9|nr:nuclease-related domain-containing protein [Salinicoccus sp. YB14-2]